MIIGIGTDLVQISRIAKSLARFGDKFAQRLLTEEEFAVFMRHADKPRYLAGRFAAKEAAVKALGIGFSQGIWFDQIGARPDPHGKPELYFLTLALQAYQKKGVQQAHLSITHEKDYALAFVVLES